MKLAHLEANAARAALELEHITHELDALEAAAAEVADGPTKEVFAASVAELRERKAMLVEVSLAWQKALEKEPKPEKVEEPPPPPAEPVVIKRAPKPAKDPVNVACCKCSADVTHASRTLGRDPKNPKATGFWCDACRKAKT